MRFVSWADDAAHRLDPTNDIELKRLQDAAFERFLITLFMAVSKQRFRAVANGVQCAIRGGSAPPCAADVDRTRELLNPMGIGVASGG